MALSENTRERRVRASLAPWLKGVLVALGSVSITMLGLLLITFIIGRVMPIDPVLAIVGERASHDCFPSVPFTW